MPSSVVKSFAKQTGKSVEEVEKVWDEAQEIAKKDHDLKYSEPGEFWKFVTFLTKKMLHITDKGSKKSFKEFLNSEE